MSRIVVVSNRVPAPAGNAGAAGGLAVALLGLMERRGGLWFGWSGAVADREQDRPDLAERNGVGYATIDLSEAEHRGYYTGYSNGVLWPTLHALPHLMSFRRQDCETYRGVNSRFADNLTPLLRDTDRVWVHDYHLMSLPGALRERGVGNPTGFFLHVPFPAPEAAAAAPGIARLIEDVLHADLLGFQTALDRDNFAATAALAGATRTGDEVLECRGRTVRLGVFPAEIGAREFAATAATRVNGQAATRLARSLAGQPLLLGVDRLDPTKGLPERLEAFRRLLARRQSGPVIMLQIAAPSREDVVAYRRLRQELDAAGGAINSEFGEPDGLPLRLLARPQNRETIAGFMRLARVGVVTPLRDGMNLVAKEYVAAQDPQSPGVLVLSRFAGAAAQLGGALLVNPHDAEGMAEAMQQALSMPLAERCDRWRENWAAIADASPEGWGENFLRALGGDALAGVVPVGHA